MMAAVLRASLAAAIAVGSLGTEQATPVVCEGNCGDEHSLIQQRAKEVPISFLQTWQLTQQLSQSHSPASLSKLTEGLQQMAAARSQQGTALDIPTSSALNGIREQMETIKKDTESEHQLAIHQLNELYGAITSCTAPATTKQQSAKDKLQTQHDTCRTEEAAAKGFLLNAQVEYEALTNPPQPCYGQFNDGLLGKLEDHEVMMSCIEKIQDWAKALRGGGPRKKSNYDKAKDRYIKKLASCSSLQHQFESSFCELRTTVDDSCASLTTCFEQNLATWEKSKPDFKTLEGSRKATFQAAEKVLCLVTEMLKPVVKEADIAKCDKLMVDTSSLTLPAFRKPPSTPICDTSAVATFPCEKGFVPRYYTSQDWYDAAPTDPCTPCTFSGDTASTTAEPATTTGSNPAP